MSVWFIAVIPIKAESFAAEAPRFLRAVNDLRNAGEAIKKGRDRIGKINQEIAIDIGWLVVTDRNRHRVVRRRHPKRMGQKATLAKGPQ